jgi:hypothetical protein
MPLHKRLWDSEHGHWFHRKVEKDERKKEGLERGGEKVLPGVNVLYVHHLS